MGQHLASFREFFRMDGERSSTDVYAEGRQQRCQFNMSEHQVTDNERGHYNESNGNEPTQNVNKDSNNEAELNANLVDNPESDLSFDNHNSRFESIYSQAIDQAQESTQDSSNGNFASSAEGDFKREARSGSSSSGNSSSSSEDSPVNPPSRRAPKTLSFGKQKIKQRNKDPNAVCNHVLSTKKKRSNWVLKFNCAKSKGSKNIDIPDQPNNSTECVCTGYRRTEEHPMGAGVVFNNRSAPQSPVFGPLPLSPVIDLSRFNPAEYPMEVRLLY